MDWKRKLSGALAAVMLLGSVPTTAFAWNAPDVANWEQASREGVKARFFVGSDTHIGRNDAASEKLKNALDVFDQVDPQADGVLLVGDVTNNGYESEYATLMGIVNGSELGKAGKVQLSMGNHEYNYGTMDRFETQTGQSANQVIYYNADGSTTSNVSAITGLTATVVKLSAKNYGGDYTDQYKMLQTALETAGTENPSAPVIVMGHHGIRNTAYVTDEWYGNYGKGTDKDMVALMAKYPQVIHISGHSHSTLEDARSIYQDDGFTAIQDGTIGAYFENETGKVDPSTGKPSTYPEGCEDASQALRIDVLNGGTVEIYRMDLTEGAYMYENEPWTFSSSSLPYTNARSTSSTAPSFQEGAEVTAESVTGSSMIVKFPAAKEHSESNVDMIHSYKITLTDSDGNETVHQVWSNYYKAEKDRKQEWSVKVADLQSETTYSIAVQAVTSFGEASEPITAASDVTTGEGYKPVYPAEPILDVDFSRDPSGADAKGHTLKTCGEPQFVQDETLNRTVAVFDGSDDGLRYAMTSEDYEKLTRNFTVELYYMPLDTKNNNPLGNTQNSGFCFEQKSGTNTLQFWAHIGGSYEKPETDVTQGQWNHVVGTYDGSNVKIYVNGQLKDTVAASGSLSEPPHYLFLGGDTMSGGDLEYQANCKIALARVYTGTMTADDVMKAYQTASQTGDAETVPAADILDVDFSTGAEADHSANSLTAVKRGSGTISYVEDKAFGKKVASFDGSSAYSYPMSEQYDKLKGGMTFEVTFNYNALDSSKEYDLLSNQQSGGFGLGTDGGKLKFFCHVGGVYKTPSTTMLPAGEWHHAAGVYDGDHVKLYVDGKCVDTVAASGSIGLPGSGANEMFIGGDSNANNALQFPSDVKIATARIYGKALTANQIAALAKQELPKTDTTKPVLAFVSVPNTTCILGDTYTVPAMTVTEDSDYTAEVTLTLPDGTSQTIPDADYLIQNGYSYTPQTAGTYKLTYTVTDAAGNAAEKVLTVTVVDPSHADLPTADMLDVDFADGTAKDESATQNTVSTIGSPVIRDDEEMGKKTAAFNGSYDAYLYPFDDAKYGKMKQAVTIESVFRYNEIPATGEYDIFSNQQSGGVGLGLENGRLQFYCNVEGRGYVQPNAAIEAGKWYHAVGVFNGSRVQLYLNGQLVDEKDAGGTAVHWTASANAKNFVIGGDSSSIGGAEFYSNGSVSVARLYSQSMTEEQVALLYRSIEPAMIEIKGSIGSMPLNRECSVPTATSSSGKAVTVRVTGPNGQEITPADGKFTPAAEGRYTFTYTVEGSNVKRTIVRNAVDTENLPVNLGLVAAEQAAAGGMFNVSIHMNRDSSLTVGKTSFDLTYDPAMVVYQGQENAKGGLTIEDDGNGRLHVEYTGTVTADDFNNYSTTRLVKLTFAAKDRSTDGSAAFGFENVNVDAATGRKNTAGTAVKIYGQSSLDLNGDGVIGAGDVALAENDDQRKLIAAQAAIYPYKHAVVLTMDGGGVCFRPDQMYYAANGETVLTDDADIMAKRTNDYAMKLFNEYCATSYSARSETPTISAQNYTSILHGKEYATAQSEYKIDNTKTGVYYYPDFGKTEAVYPSVFKALGISFPTRANAAFAEWTQIVNGIVEPDAPTYTHGSTKNTGNMQDVADYIRSDAYKNTAMVYMQSDYMDSVGHSKGYYTDTYYTELKKYDAYFQAIMDALEETGAKDETLVLFTADHGGTIGGSHGGASDQEYDVQIAMGGQTIDSGRKLDGGTNHDIPALVLAALRGEKPASMDGTAALFEQASLNQEQMSEKNRNIEKVTATAGTNVNAVELTLSNPQAGRTVRVADVVMNLNGQTVNSIEANGTVLREEVRDGKLYLTVSCQEAPTTLARVNLNGSAGDVTVEEFMLGTSEGEEIYGDLVNTTGVLTEKGSHSGGSSSSGSALYSVTVSASANGTVSVSSKTAVKGSTVTVTVKPDDGYQMQSLAVTDKNGKSVTLTEKNGRYSFTMPADNVTVKAIFEKTASTGSWTFADVPAAYWAYDSIQKAYEKGYMNGKSAMSFQPDGSVTRQQLWMILARLSGSQPSDMAEARTWAVNNGISDGSNPGTPVTRQQMVTILYRYAAMKGYDISDRASLSAFADSVSVAEYAKDALSWAIANHIVSGTNNGTLNPTGTATRAQFATILMRLESAITQ